mmetsp:Transcript_31925/g.91624  ORF Transcript_31925/g.91624 Transcript_31925/m.91624 type:complete len:116 (-) Transcript_31925:94-441(-)
MWGCRVCDWDVCEGRCHPETMTLQDVKASLTSVDARIEELLQKGDGDMKTQLALEEAKVHALEKRLDNSSAKDLAEASILQMSEEEARAEKKELLRSTEKVLAKLESIFAGLKGG